jgi:hypothetical protein
VADSMKPPKAGVMFFSDLCRFHHSFLGGFPLVWTHRSRHAFFGGGFWESVRYALSCCSQGCALTVAR